MTNPFNYDETVWSAVNDSIRDALQSLPLGLPEEEVRTAVTLCVSRRLYSPIDLLEGRGAIDDAIRTLIQDGHILQLVIGGRVRLVRLDDYVTGEAGDR